MTSILVIKETIKRNQFTCHYLKNKKHFCEFYSAILKSRLNFEHFQKKDNSPDWFIFEITDSEKRGKIIALKTLS